jgi:predicted Fe-S protein YdhL (DUF1289 family)
MSSELQDAPSPCIGLCQLASATELCEGCFRSAAEIEAWWDMTPAQKRRLLAELDMRRRLALAEA